jgi:endoglucanase
MKRTTTEALPALKSEAERAALLDGYLARRPATPALKVSGNQLLTADGTRAWLQGLSADSMQWSMGEHVLWSIHVAIDRWHANAIRLAVEDTFWFGRGRSQPAGAQEQYRQAVDHAVRLCAVRGAYLVLDLHHFGAPRQADV